MLFISWTRRSPSWGSFLETVVTFFIYFFLLIPNSSEGSVQPPPTVPGRSASPNGAMQSPTLSLHRWVVPRMHSFKGSTLLDLAK